MNFRVVAELEDPLLCESGTKSPEELAQRSQLLLMSAADLRRGLRCSRSLPQTCAEVSAAPKFDYPKSQISEHLRMLLQSLRALCEAPGGPGSIRQYLETLGRATGESGRFGCGFWTDLHFADDEYNTHFGFYLFHSDMTLTI